MYLNVNLIYLNCFYITSAFVKKKLNFFLCSTIFVVWTMLKIVIRYSLQNTMLTLAQDDKLRDQGISIDNAINKIKSNVLLPRWKQDDMLVRISHITWIAMNVFVVTVP